MVKPFRNRVRNDGLENGCSRNTLIGICVLLFLIGAGLTAGIVVVGTQLSSAQETIRQLQATIDDENATTTTTPPTTTVTTAPATTVAPTTTTTATTVTTVPTTTVTTVPATTTPPPPPFTVSCSDFYGPLEVYASVPTYNVSGQLCFPFTVSTNTSGLGDGLKKRKRDDDDGGETILPYNITEQTIDSADIMPIYSQTSEAVPISNRFRFKPNISNPYSYSGTDPSGILNNQSYASIDGGDIYKMQVQSNDLNVYIYDAQTQALVTTLNLSSILPIMCLNSTNLPNHPISVRFDWRNKQFIIMSMYNTFISGAPGYFDARICLAISTNETGMVFNSYVYQAISTSGGDGFSRQYVGGFETALFGNYYLAKFRSGPTVPSGGNYLWVENMMAFNRTLGAIGVTPNLRVSGITCAAGGTFPCHGKRFSVSFVHEGRSPIDPTISNYFYMSALIYENTTSTSILWLIRNVITSLPPSVIFQTTIASYNLVAMGWSPIPPAYCDQVLYPSIGPTGCYTSNGVTFHIEPAAVTHAYYYSPSTGHRVVIMFKSVGYNLAYLEYQINGAGGDGMPSNMQPIKYFNSPSPGSLRLVAPSIAYDCRLTLYMSLIVVSTTRVFTAYTYKLSTDATFRNYTELAPPTNPPITTGSFALPQMMLDLDSIKLRSMWIPQYFSSNAQMFRVNILNETYTTNTTATDSCGIAASCTRTVYLRTEEQCAY